MAVGYEIVNFDSWGRKARYDWGDNWGKDYVPKVEEAVSMEQLAAEIEKKYGKWIV